MIMGWASSKESLPDEDQCVLVATEDGEVWTGYLDGGEWYYASADRIGVEVTHWMDFPLPPGAHDPATITTPPAWAERITK